MSLTLKRHYYLWVLLILVVGGLAWGLHDVRIVAYTVPATNPPVIAGSDYGGDAVALFDDTVVHSVQVLISDDDYQAMITTYRETGSKDYFHADVIIDGVRVSDVGVRLKGNASLRTALGGNGGNGRMGGGGGVPGGGGPGGGGAQGAANGGANAGGMPAGGRDAAQGAANNGGGAGAQAQPTRDAQAAPGAGGNTFPGQGTGAADDNAAAAPQAMPAGGPQGAGGAGGGEQQEGDGAFAAPPQENDGAQAGGDVTAGGQAPAGQPAAGPQDATPQAGGQAAGELPQDAPQGNRVAAGAAANGAPAGDGQTTATAQTSAKLPLLVKFNAFVSGQTYQGYSALAIRTYGSSRDEAMLQEPLTDYVFLASGLSAPQTAFAGVAVGSQPEQLYTISEIINDTYISTHMENPGGVLYKAEVGADLTYQGDDPSTYARSFTQQTRVNDADLAPLIELMRFITESDDATFENELDQHLDVDALATYLAINNLLVNTDSLVGMSNNYYLYCDPVTERFTLLMWDANESMGKMSRGGQAATYDLYFASQQQGGGRMGGGMGGRSNILVQRFLASDRFMALYEEKLQQVYQAMFAEGALAAQAEQFADLVRAANTDRDLVDLTAYDQAVAQTEEFIAQRQSYLAGTSLLGGTAGTAPATEAAPTPGQAGQP